MRLLDLTLDTPAANLALDEALLDACEAGELPPGGVLRLWESPASIVVVGRGSRLADEVLVDACRQSNVPILRRVSGGMAIVAGPGCLMYAVVDRHPPGVGASIPRLHHHVLSTFASALCRPEQSIELAGTSDLAIADANGTRRKVSGNSLRLSRQSYLYHGTVMYDFDLPLISQCLPSPPRSPEYRKGRIHADFLANCPSNREELAASIAAAYKASENLSNWPRDRVEHLVASRYATDQWNLSR